MLDQTTKRKLDSARQILVGKVPDPKAQVEQITTALVYKFMDDMDKESEELGGEAKFFANGFSQYAWTKLLDNKLSGQERLDLYVQAITNMSKNPHIPQLFRDIFKGAFLPYNDPRTLSLFLKEINEFNYEHSENLGNAFEYLLSILGSQGDAGQFRTPRHIIDFIVEVVDPKKNETILDPACGTAGFLISAYKHILKTNKEKPLTPDEKLKLMNNLAGYDISPDMVKLALVNMYLHGFPEPKIHEYDSLTSEKRWDETFDVILANPPFMTPKGGINPHKRFSIQSSRAELLFVDYIIGHLKIAGRAGIIVPDTLLYLPGKAYKQLRKELINNNLIAIVSLPEGAFNPYAKLSTSILIIEPSIAKKSKKIIYCKIKNDGFGNGAVRRPIKENDIPKAISELQDALLAINSDKEKNYDLISYLDKSDIDTNEYTLLNSHYNVENGAELITNAIKFGDLFEISGKERAKNQKLPILSVTMHNGLIEQSSRFKQRMASANTSTYKVVENGELVVGFPIDEGVLGFQTKYDKAIVSPAYDIWKLKNPELVHIPFLERVLRTNAARQLYIKNMRGAIGRRRTIPKTKLKDLYIPLPPLEKQKEIMVAIQDEQKRIDELNSKIESHNQNITNLIENVWTS